jgi:hypothetical protein
MPTTAVRMSRPSGNGFAGLLPNVTLKRPLEKDTGIVSVHKILAPCCALLYIVKTTSTTPISAAPVCLLNSEPEMLTGAVAAITGLSATAKLNKQAPIVRKRDKFIFTTPYAKPN